MIKTTILMLIAAIAMTACSSNDCPDFTSQSPAHKIETSNCQKRIVNKGNQLALNAWELICEANSNNDGNQFFSPISLQIALSLLANGAEGDLLNELINLYVDGSDENGLDKLNELNKKLLVELPLVDKSVKLNFANSIWCTQEFDFQTDYANRCLDIYNATSHKYDIGTEKARKDFNQWAADNTNGMISEFMKQPPLASAMLANATYFKGFWRYPFKKDRTERKNFTCQSGKSRQIEMMHSDGYFYLAKDNSQMSYVELPYLNMGFSMNILMPKDGADFNECIHNFAANHVKWDITGKAKVSIPKFTIEASYNDLIGVAEKMGVANIGSPAKGILKNADFKIGQISQSSKIIVNEDGSEAAAVTLVGSTSGSVRELDININRPFFFTITEQSTGIILFMGKVAEF